MGGGVRFLFLFFENRGFASFVRTAENTDVRESEKPPPPKRGSLSCLEREREKQKNGTPFKHHHDRFFPSPLFRDTSPFLSFYVFWCVFFFPRKKRGKEAR